MLTDSGSDFVGWDFLASDGEGRIAGNGIGVRINGRVYGSGVT